MFIVKSTILRRCADEDGSVTVESVLWIPFFLGIIGIIFDSTSLMLSQTDLWNTASDASRQVALRRMTPEEAEAYIRSRGGDRAYEPRVEIDGDTVTTVVSRPFSDVPGLGLVTSGDGVLSASAYFRMEPSLESGGDATTASASASDDSAGDDGGSTGSGQGNGNGNGQGNGQGKGNGR